MRVKSSKRMPEPRHGRLGGGGVNERMHIAEAMSRRRTFD